MSPPRKTPAEAEASTEQQLEERSGEAQRVEEYAEEEETAAQHRQREESRAAELKSVPEGALPPLEKTARGGETSYKRDHLLANALALTGHEPHVLVGALYGNDQEYLTVKEVQSAVDFWIDTEDLTEG